MRAILVGCALAIFDLFEAFDDTPAQPVDTKSMAEEMDKEFERYDSAFNVDPFVRRWRSRTGSFLGPRATVMMVEDRSGKKFLARSDAPSRPNENEKLRKQVAALQARNAELEAQNKALSRAVRIVYQKAVPHATITPHDLAAAFTGIFDPVGMPLRPLSNKSKAAPVHVADRFVHEVLANLGVEIGNLSAVQEAVVVGPVACFNDTMTHCSTIAHTEVLHCLSMHSVSDECAASLNSSLPAMCERELRDCHGSVIACLETRELSAQCQDTYDAVRAHTAEVKAGLDAGINIINEITGRTRPLVGDEPEYYAMFNHFDL